MGEGPEVRPESGLKNVPSVVFDQLRATLLAADFARIARSAKPVEVKTEARREEVAPRRSKIYVKPQPKKKPPKAERIKTSRMKSRRDEDPSDSSDSSNSDDSSDASSDSSNDSPDEYTQSQVVLPSAARAGTTTLTLRPYVNSAILGMFDEKALISDRKNWREKFTNMFVQGGWTSQVKIRELKMMLPSSSSWKNQSAEFRGEKLKSRTSEPEPYFTMKQKSSALDFVYRLNEATVKAGIKYRKAKREREEHIKRFLKNLKDSQLKVMLRKQRFKDLEDLVYVLKQDRDVVVDGYDSSSSQKRDFRADNIPYNRHRPKGRAFVGLRHDRFEDEVEELKTSDGTKGPGTRKNEWVKLPDGDQTNRDTSLDGNHLDRVANHPTKPYRNEFGETCMKFGHKERNCSINLVCERCGKSGHPDHACRARPCSTEICVTKINFETIETVKNLARNGVLKGAPPDILKKLLDEKADPGKSLN
ncbi:LOW QUALITY PROTEIN: hypothetical protein PHMEG_00012725 [Phytophthora megakarya]|uniref:CCHC-type domain-containing protein n=1 Tax=Phytophthora megakarya TaxID=4795 RepID=A0A225W9P4_9STRA|nr:LOW QUALITY PROTEIN: hypothetical protein PHMEG_00012725 [Phytophthora megakarya]